MNVRACALAVLVAVVAVGWDAGRPRAAGAVTVWDYAALGDSLAFGMWAFQGYVPRYERYVEADTGATVNQANLGVPGWTSADLLRALRSDWFMRLVVGGSEIVTWDIGGNDLLDARGQYRSRTCGGADNQDCLRAGIATFKANWDAIIAELKALRAGKTTSFRTMDIYNPYVNEDRARDTWPQDAGNDFVVFKPYLDEANRHIAASATANGVPYARVYLAFNGPTGVQDPSDKGYLSFDELHPNERGHRVIAEQLRTLGFAPLR